MLYKGKIKGEIINRKPSNVEEAVTSKEVTIIGLEINLITLRVILGAISIIYDN